MSVICDCFTVRDYVELTYTVNTTIVCLQLVTVWIVYAFTRIFIGLHKTHI